MRRVRARRRDIGGAPTSGGTVRIATVAGAAGTARARRRSGVSRRTASVCATFTGTFGNGFRIAGTPAMPARRATGAPGRAATVPSASSAAVPGAAVRGSSARRIAAGTSPGTGSTISASAWPGRSPLESLPPRGFGGLPPGRVRTRPAKRSAAGAMSVDGAGERASARDGTGAGGALPLLPFARARCGALPASERAKKSIELLPGSAGVPRACAQSAQRRQRRCRRHAGAPREAFPWTQRRDVSKQLSLLVVAANFLHTLRQKRLRSNRIEATALGVPDSLAEATDTRWRALAGCDLRDWRGIGGGAGGFREAPLKNSARRQAQGGCGRRRVPFRRVRSFLLRDLRGAPASRRWGGGRSQRSPGSFRNRRLPWTREAIGGRLVARLCARFL